MVFAGEELGDDMSMSVFHSIDSGRYNTQQYTGPVQVHIHRVISSDNGRRSRRFGSAAG